MNTKKIICLGLLLMAGLIASAQTQQGYVKTKGRSVKGKVIEGERLSGTMVQVKGRSAVLSKNNGTFSFPIPGKKYMLEQVQKQGYILMDPDVLSRPYTYSPDPLVIVLEDKKQHDSDKREMSATLRSSSYIELQRRNEEIESLREQNRISEERYRELKRKWEEDYDGNEDLINSLVEQYMKIDFDALDAFGKRFNNYLINGQVNEADSLIHSLGDVDVDIKNLSKVHDQNVKDRKALNKREEAESKKRMQIADRLYKHFMAKRAKHDNDSARIYLIKRSNLDTTNAEWLIDVGEFVSDNLAAYDEALMYYEKAVIQSSRNDGEQSHFWNMAMGNMGYIYDLLGDINNAEMCHNKALNGWKHLYGDEHVEVATSILNLGALDVNKGNLSSALERTQEALEIYKKVTGESSDKVANAYNNLATIYFYMGNYDLSLKTFNDALAMQKSALGEVNNAVATSYSNLAVLYNLLGNWETSFSYHQMALNTYKMLYGETHPAVARCYYNIGSHYKDMGDGESAMEYTRKALKIYKKIYGEAHSTIASCYHNIGSIYKAMAVYDSSLYYAEKALEMDLRVHGEYHPSTALAYGNIGSFYSETDNYSKALEYLMRERRILLAISGENSDDLAVNNNNIGTLHLHLHEYDTALHYFREAMSIWEQQLGGNNPMVANATNGIGQVYQSKGDYKKALEFLQRSLDINLGAYGEQHHAVASAYHNLGSTYNQMKQFDKAKQCYEKAVAIYRNVLGDNHPTTAMTYAAIGILYGDMGNSDSSLIYLNKSYSILESVYEEDGHTNMAKVLHNIGTLYYNRKEYAKSLEYVQRAHTIYLKLLGEKHPSTVATQTDIDILNSMLKKKKK